MLVEEAKLQADDQKGPCQQRGRGRNQDLAVVAGDYFFFFQAEDGIRDLTVTGVQTCALPISRRSKLLGGSLKPPAMRGRVVLPFAPLSARCLTSGSTVSAATIGCASSATT